MYGEIPSSPFCLFLNQWFLCFSIFFISVVLTPGPGELLGVLVFVVTQYVN